MFNIFNKDKRLALKEAQVYPQEYVETAVKSFLDTPSTSHIEIKDVKSYYRRSTKDYCLYIDLNDGITSYSVTYSARNADDAFDLMANDILNDVIETFGINTKHI